MSQDDVTVAVQSCVTLVKEVQRRVDGAPLASIDAGLKKNLVLAKAALQQALKKDTAARNSSELTTESSSNSLSQNAKGDGRRGSGPSSQPKPAALSTSFDLAKANKQRDSVLKSGPLWSVVLCGFQWNKRKLREQSLTTMQQLLRCEAVDLELHTTLFLSPYTSSSGSSSGQTAGPEGSNNSVGVRQTKALCRVGEGVFVVLGEYLGTAPEPAVQTRILLILQSLIEGGGSAFFVSKTVTRVLHAAFTVALQTTQEAVRVRSQHFLQLCVAHVTQRFVREATGSVNGASGFATNTVLEDYTIDVEFDASFTHVEVLEYPSQIEGGNDNGDDRGRQQRDPRHRGSTHDVAGRPLSPILARGGGLGGTAASAAAAESAPPEPLLNPKGCGGLADGGKRSSFTPASFYRSSLDENAVREALGILGPEARLPQPLKDFLSLIRTVCRLATRPLTGSPTEGNVDVRARLLALRMLELLFHELPVANCEAEHRCATWLSLALTACRYDLIRVLVRNLSVVTPFAFFASSVRVLSLMLRKCHYHMARELHTLLAVSLLPLARSRYSNFRQKHAVLAMIRELFSTPHLLISYFINYDCSPTFDAEGQYGGILELLVDFVVELTFTDIVALDADEEDWLSPDQQQLLRGDSVVALQAFVKSMYRWVTEDPQSYMLSFLRSQQRIPGNGGGGGGGGNAAESGRSPDQWAELYLDNWTSDTDSDAEEGDAGGGGVPTANSEASSFADGFGSSALCRKMSFSTDRTTGAAVPQWGKHHDISYHWKHIHFLMHNKRIALDAVELINTGKWKDAKEFLESRRYLPSRQPSAEELVAMETADVSGVPVGESSYAEIARFAMEHPGVSRRAISDILDRVNKDPACKLFLRDYLHLFRYHGVPIDVAMRDTTCKFMSWDRPMFEAQVWETIQACFGEEYAKQNPAVISAKDADTMAGVLLFLHSNLHSEIAKSSRFTIDQFVVDANACLDIPMEASELRAVFVRVQRRKWALDPYGRTPAEVERASTVPSLSFQIITKWLFQDQTRGENAQRQRACEAAEEATTKEEGGTGEGGGDRADHASPPPPPPPRDPSFVTSSSTGSASPSPLSSFARNQSSLFLKNDLELLDPSPPTYCDSKESLKLREDHHIAFTRAAGLYAEKLQALHRRFASDRDSYHPQPYAVPHYAEHVRPMLLFYYPSVMACVYMGFRVLEAAPLSRQLLEITQILYDLAAVFVVNLGDMHDAVSAMIERCLAEEHAYKLTPPTRATFVAFLLNSI